MQAKRTKQGWRSGAADVWRRALGRLRDGWRRTRVATAARVAIPAAALVLGSGCHLREYWLNGCKVGPNYHKPAAPIADHWIDADDVRLRAESDDHRRWWTSFNDPVLNDLICMSYEQNLTLREAGFRVLQARDILAIEVGRFFPQTQEMQGDFTQRGVSVAVANRTATPQRFFGQWDYGFALAWELDFWGRFRRTIESANARLDASIEGYDDALVTLLGDVASTYVRLRTQEAQLELVKANVWLQRETLKIASARFKGGLTSELDVDQAQSTLSQTEAQAPQLEIQIRQANNALCVLLGIAPQDLAKRIGTGKIPEPPPDVAVGIPAELLLRRPDIRRADRLAASACYEIGVAKSDLLPRITVNGTVGYSAQELPNLFTAPGFRGAIAPSFNWPILNYGRLINRVRLEQARFYERVTSFQNTVLKANQEAEDAMVVFLKAHSRVKYLEESVAAAMKAVKIALAQYKAGTVDFNRVSLLEQNLVAQQDLLVQARGQIATGLVGIYRALGGGWQIRLDGCCATGEPAPPPPTPFPGGGPETLMPSPTAGKPGAPPRVTTSPAAPIVLPSRPAQLPAVPKDAKVETSRTAEPAPKRELPRELPKATTPAVTSESAKPVTRQPLPAEPVRVLPPPPAPTTLQRPAPPVPTVKSGTTLRGLFNPKPVTTPTPSREVTPSPRPATVAAPAKPTLDTVAPVKPGTYFPPAKPAPDEPTSTTPKTINRSSLPAPAQVAPVESSPLIPEAIFKDVSPSGLPLPPLRVPAGAPKVLPTATDKASRPTRLPPLGAEPSREHDATTNEPASQRK